MAATMSAAIVAPVASRQVAFKPASKTFKSVSVSNGTIAKTTAFQVWQPTNNKFFETFSFLPPLTSEQITKQVDYIVNNSWTPCLEFADSATAYVADTNTVRLHGTSAGYQDNRYWSMWKLPMFGCTDGNQVLKEIAACTKAFPDAYVRLVAFDPSRQVQIAGFLVARPASAKDFRAPNARSVA